MEMKRINIKLKIPVVYDDNQFMMDIYQGELEAKCKTFTTEVKSMKKKWLLVTFPNPVHIDTIHTVTQIYSNLVEDGTWKNEFTDTYKIVALTTLVYKMKASIAKNTIALTNQTGKPTVDSANHRTGNNNNMNNPYMVAAWRIEKKGITPE